MAIEALVLAITTLLLLYVRSKWASSTSKMYWRRNKRNSAVLGQCVRLKCGYTPTFWARNAHIQTMLGFVRNFFTNRFEFTKELLQMHDGGTVTLEWFKHVNERHDGNSNKKIPSIKPLLIISGWILGPDTEEICQTAYEQGYNPVVYKSRGQDTPLTTRLLPAYLDAADFCEAVDYIHAQHRFSDIFAVGFSLGCAPVLGYLGAKGKSSLIKSAVCISTSVDLESTLNAGLKNPYHQIITEYFKDMIIKNQCLHPLLDMAKIGRGSSLRDLFEHGHTLVHQCSSIDEYIKLNNPTAYVNHIRTPTLFINALDDPVLDVLIPAHLVLKNNSYCMEIITEKGGHCGFKTGFLANSWSTDVALEFHNAVMDHSLLLSPIRNGFTRLRSCTR
eukprot:gene8868-9817_t